ncbi:hypothetical protein [Pseudoalteromonas luteoviolacea]|uniref:Polymerase nucleotidyl transferase domain-containing protein n=1 Tax=Pseudoalteromonas luteoviolacea NCIMB 1942 TaxID=1365253 RepID=A0A166ZHP1_9GAMM|nr:hypothetical protein [Pseudoalteromonas luteoviolacea]KZN44326.1 hypothetical protein N482_16925 [Pseudoalteromonas luteoviolacea NCIMB 1942]KZW99292.1 hypothetical protein JL49_17980 [Pseudoalteromonas luteoviolacea]
MYIINRAMGELEDFKSCIGVFGVGSYFNNTYNEKSDIDIYVIKDTDMYVKKSIYFEGTHLDITVCSLKSLYFSATKGKFFAFLQETLRTAHLLKDTDSQVSQCLNHIQQYAQETQRPPNQFDIKNSKAFITNCARKLEQHQSNNFMFISYMSDWSTECYKLNCMVEKISSFESPVLKGKHISEEFPKLHSVIEKVMNTHSTDLRSKLINDYTQHLLTNSYPNVKTEGVFKRVKFPLR